MLKYIFLLFLNLGINFAFGQEFVYIDSEYILKNIPEYIQAKENNKDETFLEGSNILL